MPVEALSQMTTKINETIVNISNIASSSRKTAFEINKVSEAAIDLNLLVEKFRVCEVQEAADDEDTDPSGDTLF